MRVLSKYNPGSLLTHLTYPKSSFIIKKTDRELFTSSPPIEIKSATTMHRLIMIQKQLQLIPVYLQYYQKFQHPGVRRNTNYHLYLKRIELLMQK